MASDSNDTHSKDNDDIKQHLLKIEERLDRLSLSPQLNFASLSAHQNDEIDLREIWNILWDGKWWIIGITFLFAVGSVILAITLPNQYKAEVILAPAQKEGGGLSGLAAQYGGLAAMAGINLSSGQSSDINEAIALVKSWPFLEELVNKYNLKPLVLAVKKWDDINNQIIFDADVYDQEKQLWVREAEPNKPSEPTSYEIFEALVDMISISQDDKTGLIRMTVEHYSPVIAHTWLEMLVNEVNQYFQQRDMAEAARNIEYLQIKANETSIAEMQAVFYRMIEAQTKTQMLAEVSGEYLMKTVVKSKLPEVKSRPKRALICIVGVMLGGVFSVVFVVALHLYSVGKN